MSKAKNTQSKANAKNAKAIKKPVASKPVKKDVKKAAPKTAKPKTAVTQPKTSAASWPFPKGGAVNLPAGVKTGPTPEAKQAVKKSLKTGAAADYDKQAKASTPPQAKSTGLQPGDVHFGDLPILSAFRNPLAGGSTLVFIKTGNSNAIRFNSSVQPKNKRLAGSTKAVPVVTVELTSTFIENAEKVSFKKRAPTTPFAR